MPDQVEPSGAQQVAQLGGTTLDVTRDQSVAHVYDPCLGSLLQGARTGGA